MSSHIYTAEPQPATNFIDRTGPGRPQRYRIPGGRALWCRHCQSRRRARNMRAAVYYDEIRFFCARPCARAKRSGQ